jgi:hypothetical protein
MRNIWQLGGPEKRGRKYFSDPVSRTMEVEKWGEKKKSSITSHPKHGITRTFSSFLLRTT